MKQTIIIVFILTITGSIYAIDPPLTNDTLLLKNNFERPKHSKFTQRRLGTYTFFGEAGYFYGYYKGLRYSFNFDCILQSTENSSFSARIGIGYTEAVNDSTVKGSDIFYPLSLHFLFGVENNFDLGAGMYIYKNRGVFTPFIFLGFRHQNPRGGFMYRAGADIHLEHLLNMNGVELQKTAVYGPLIGIGWSF